jgi:galactokinase
LPEQVYKRASHVVDEIERTQHAVPFFENRDGVRYLTEFCHQQ